MQTNHSPNSIVNGGQISFGVGAQVESLTTNGSTLGTSVPPTGQIGVGGDGNMGDPIVWVGSSFQDAIEFTNRELASDLSSQTDVALEPNSSEALTGKKTPASDDQALENDNVLLSANRNNFPVALTHRVRNSSTPAGEVADAVVRFEHMPDDIETDSELMTATPELTSIKIPNLDSPNFNPANLDSSVLDGQADGELQARQVLTASINRPFSSQANRESSAASELSRQDAQLEMNQLVDSAPAEKNCWVGHQEIAKPTGDLVMSTEVAHSIADDLPMIPSQGVETTANSMKSLPQFASVSMGQSQIDNISQMGSTSIVTSPSNPTPPAAQQFVDMFVRDVSHVANQGEQKITMHLHPPEMGKLTVEVGWENDVVSASIVASERTTSETLIRDRTWLLNNLTASGFEISSFDVSHDETGSHDSMQGDRDKENLGGGNRQEIRSSKGTSQSEVSSNVELSPLEEAIMGSRHGINVMA